MPGLSFRAWDIEKKRYHEDTTEAWRGRLEVLEVNMRGAAALRTMDNFTDATGRFILEPFTGLTDKHGKGIFLGDIVKHDDPVFFDGSQDASLVDKVGGGTAEVVEDDFGFRFKEINCGEWCFYSYDGAAWERDKLEVVGNIHENPELLANPKYPQSP